MQLGTSGPRGKGVKRSTARSRSHEAEICHENSFQLSDEFSPHPAGIYYDKCPSCHNNLDTKVKGQRSYKGRS